MQLEGSPLRPRVGSTGYVKPTDIGKHWDNVPYYRFIWGYIGVYRGYIGIMGKQWKLL